MYKVVIEQLKVLASFYQGKFEASEVFRSPCPGAGTELLSPWVRRASSSPTRAPGALALVYWACSGWLANGNVFKNTHCIGGYFRTEKMLGEFFLLLGVNIEGIKFKKKKEQKK